jgi:hypothetical protein
MRKVEQIRDKNRVGIQDTRPSRQAKVRQSKAKQSKAKQRNKQG